MTTPDLIAGVVGFRSWVIDDDAWLASTNMAGIWKPGENVSRCRGGGSMRMHFPGAAPPPPPDHRAPHENCGCGLYALHSVKGAEQYTYAEGPAVVGAVVAWGRLCVHPTGFRAERARIVVLAPMAGENRHVRTSVLNEVARIYGAKVVEPELLELAATDFGAPVPPALIPEHDERSAPKAIQWGGMTPGSFHHTHFHVPPGTGIQFVDPPEIKFKSEPAASPPKARIWPGIIVYAVAYVMALFLFGLSWPIALAIGAVAQIGTFFADFWWQSRRT